MSSRQEEKERRRREREAQEAKANAASARTRRLQIVGGVVVGLAVIVVAVILVTSGGGSDGEGGPSTTSSVDVTLPARSIENLEEAAEAAGCTVSEPEIEGSTHVEDAVEYVSNPPTSGDHNPVPAQDGVYSPGSTPAKEALVHSLEHGRIQFQYQPDAPPKTIATLEAIFNEEVNGTPGYHAQVFQNTTGMEAPIAAAAWGQLVTCEDLSPEAIDTLRAFRERFTDKGPEFVP